jgi:hypothetical protein
MSVVVVIAKSEHSKRDPNFAASKDGFPLPSLEERQGSHKAAV